MSVPVGRTESSTSLRGSDQHGRSRLRRDCWWRAGVNCIRVPQDRQPARLRANIWGFRWHSRLVAKKGQCAQRHPTCTTFFCAAHWSAAVFAARFIRLNLVVVQE